MTLPAQAVYKGDCCLEMPPLYDRKKECRLFPTPTARDYKDAGTDVRHLVHKSRLVPTIQTMLWGTRDDVS